MKIFAIINISNENDLQCDSGYIFQRIIAEKLHEKGHEYHIAGADCPAFRNIQGDYFIKHYISCGTNRYSARYNFNFSEFAQLLEQVKPDVIFNCQIELTSAIRGVLEMFGNKQIPLVSYCHYPALWEHGDSIVPVLDQSLNHAKLGYNIVFNILTSVLTADAVLIQSRYALGLIEHALDYYRLPYPNKIKVLAPPADPMVACGYNIYKKGHGEESFFYNHRLYQSYGSADFLQFAQKVMRKFGLKCVVSDCMPHRSSERAKINGTPEYFKEMIQNTDNIDLINGSVSREQYRDNIVKNLFAVAAFRRSCVWSMAAMDCMSLGVPVIAPNYAAYPEFVPQELLFDNMATALKIIKEIKENKAFRLKVSDKCFRAAQKYSADKISDRLLKIFEKEISKKCVI